MKQRHIASSRQVRYADYGGDRWLNLTTLGPADDARTLTTAIAKLLWAKWRKANPHALVIRGEW